MTAHSDIPDRTVDLHTFGLCVAGEELRRCRGLLDRDEIARAGRFKRAALANCWIVCRARLREVLAGYAGGDPSLLQFSFAPHGKPSLRQGGDSPPLYFNLSHSHELAAVAVTRVAPLGVDVEFVKPIRDWSGVAARFFSPFEQAELDRVDAGRLAEAFYNCWTRKEAVIKCTGEGLSARLDAFDVSLRPGEPAAVVADRVQRDATVPWQMHHFAPYPGYVGAAALRAAQRVSWREIAAPAWPPA